MLGLHVGFMDTDMTKGLQAPKADPADVVRQTLEALQAGAHELLADQLSRDVKSGLSAAQAPYLHAV